MSVVPSAGPDEGEPVESAGAAAGPDEGEPEEPAGASAGPDEREAAEVGSVRQWTIDNRGVVMGHVSEEDARASLLELAVNVAAVRMGYYSEDDLYYLLGQHFYLLRHSLRVQAGEKWLDYGRYAGILRDLGVNDPRPVLEAIARVTVSSLDFDIAALDEALQTIYDPPVSAP